jgi:hypothetical protein
MCLLRGKIYVSKYMQKTLSPHKEIQFDDRAITKSVSNKALIETIETTYEELKNIRFGIEIIRKAEFRHEHEQLKRFLHILKIVLIKRKSDRDYI